MDELLFVAFDNVGDEIVSVEDGITDVREVMGDYIGFYNKDGDFVSAWRKSEVKVLERRERKVNE